jgi:hypothetical protein
MTLTKHRRLTTTASAGVWAGTRRSTAVQTSCRPGSFRQAVGPVGVCQGLHLRLASCLCDAAASYQIEASPCCAWRATMLLLNLDLQMQIQIRPLLMFHTKTSYTASKISSILPNFVCSEAEPACPVYVLFECGSNLLSGLVPPATRLPQLLATRPRPVCSAFLQSTSGQSSGQSYVYCAGCCTAQPMRTTKSRHRKPQHKWLS